ncbi:MAG: 50S ribosomal protein L10 [Candidatus Komeilibacteria bacterium]|nr:50S ribosomal protein L10 [Candidatus Komeilibacteria bacterium]
MPKLKSVKHEELEAAEAKAKKAKVVVLANFAGLTVKEAQELRRTLRTEQVEMQVIKKSLFQRLVKSQDWPEVPTDNLPGNLGVVFGYEDQVAPARLLHAFRKTHEAINIGGGILEGAYLSADQIKNLATLPTKEQLLGQLVGTINAPISGFVQVLSGNLRGLIQVLSAASSK